MNNYHHKPVSVTSSQCLAIVLCKGDGRELPASGTAGRTPNGHKLFQEFIDENRACFWNTALVESISSLEFVGFMRPGTLLVSASELHLQCLRNAWARRILKSPRNYAIKSLGDIGAIEMQEVPQAQFIPLPETLCLLVSNLNKCSRPATFDTVVEALKKQYAGMTIPNNEVLFATLAALLAEGKIYCMGDHYFLSTPMMYQQYQIQQSSRTPSQWCTTNDAAPYHVPSSTYRPEPAKMCTAECQTGASIINGPAYAAPSTSRQTRTDRPAKKDQAISAEEDKTPISTSRDAETKEKSGGFLTRFFRRSKSRDRKQCSQKQKEPPASQKMPNSKSFQPPNNHCREDNLYSARITEDKGKSAAVSPQLGTFCAQFPPTEWLHDPRLVRQSMNNAQPFFRGRKGRTDKNGQLSARDRQTVWVPDQDLVALKPTRRGRQRDSHRERAHGPVKSLHRLSKYMSSSSECLHYLGPVDPPSRLPDELEELDLEYAFPQRDSNGAVSHRRRQRKLEIIHQVPLSQLHVTEPVVDRHPPAPLALPTDVDLETTCTDVMGDGGGRTSTPAPSTGHDHRDSPLNNTAEIDATAKATHGSDSAFSASPVVTESSNSNKYSSWSGSETHDPNHVSPKDPMDHTYINQSLCKPCTSTNTRVVHVEEEQEEEYGSQPTAQQIDRTYENLRQRVMRNHESTVFENITAEEPDIEQEDVFNNNNNNNEKECESNSQCNSSPSTVISPTTCISAV